MYTRRLRNRRLLLLLLAGLRGHTGAGRWLVAIVRRLLQLLASFLLRTSWRLLHVLMQAVSDLLATVDC